MSGLLSQIASTLTQDVELPGGTFRVYYLDRDPPSGRSNGLRGVASRELVYRYARSLELAARTLINWGWEKPEPWDRGRVPAYVFRTADYWRTRDAPFTLTLGGQSEVGLRSFIPVPDLDVAWECADIEAVHEATHVFTHHLREMQRRNVGGEIRDDAWAWFDEATAGFMEARLFRGHREPLRHAIHFVYHPELTLNLEPGQGGGYFGAWFIRHLVQRHGPALLCKVWRHARARDSDPIAAIDEELRKIDPDDSFDRLFRDYCISSGNMWEFDFDVYTRHGNRLATESFHLGASAPSARSAEADWLHPLGCRYYRIGWTCDAVTSVDVTVRLDPPGAIDAVEAVLLPITAKGHAGDHVDLATTDGAATGSLTCQAPLDNGHASAVLVVLHRRPQDRAVQVRVEVASRPGTSGEVSA